MEDSNIETLQEFLLDEHLVLLDEDTIPCVVNDIDYFVNQSRGNTIVKHLHLCPYAFSGYADDVWDKFGQAIGNLQALEWLCIRIPYPDDGEAGPNPAWEEILARILSHVRQNIKFSVITNTLGWHAEDSRSFARAIQGHPTITSFATDALLFPHESLNALYSALATLPALKLILLYTTRR